MRTLSLNFRRALFAPRSGEIPIFLLTITHPALALPIRLSTDATARLTTDPLTFGTVSRGNAFLYAAAGITLPDEQDKTPPAAKLTVQNVTRDLVPLARSVDTPPQVAIEAVLASAPDTVEMIWPVMDMSNLTADTPTLQFDLTMDALVTEPFPAGNFGPAEFPALFF